MYEFSTSSHQTLRLWVDERGITFGYPGSHARCGRDLLVAQCWASIRALLAKLSNGQRYYSLNAALSIWKREDKLHIKFYALDRPFEETLTFSGGAAEKILCMLHNLPNLN